MSNENKKQILFQIEVLNNYCDESEYLNDGEILFLNKALPAFIGILPLKVYLINSFNLPFERLVINENVCKNNKRLKTLIAF